MAKRFLASIILLCLSKALYSQESTNSDITHGDFRFTDLFESGRTAVSEEDKISYIPVVFGAVKAKVEMSTYDGEYRFNVRNSRIGVRGFASPHMKYTIQIDFSNEGKLSILDSYATFFGKGFEISLGQQQYHFSTDLDRGPNTNWFANRSFLSKYLVSYGGLTPSGSAVTPFTANLGSRDLGLYAAYKLPIKFPMAVSAGLFNGSGAGNPEWTNTVNVVARLEIGPDDGLGMAVSHYNGKMPEETYSINYHGPGMTPPPGGTEVQFAQLTYKKDFVMWGGEIHYQKDNFRIETEYAQRRINDRGLDILHAGHVQGYYRFPVLRSKALEYISPVARWDIGKNIDYVDNTTTGELSSFNANRLTVGLNLGFVKKVMGAELRFNYENYFLKNKPGDFSRNHLLQDKFTIEIVATF